MSRMIADRCASSLERYSISSIKSICKIDETSCQYSEQYCNTLLNMNLWSILTTKSSFIRAMSPIAINLFTGRVIKLANCSIVIIVYPITLKRNCFAPTIFCLVLVLSSISESKSVEVMKDGR